MSNALMLKRNQFVLDYYQLLDQNDYHLIDLNMVEPFFTKDKDYQPSNIIFERNDKLLAIRSDWTQSILNYRQLYRLPHHRLGYYGPVIRDNQTIYQAGIEIYDATVEEMVETMVMHFSFIEQQSFSPLHTLIVNDEKLLTDYLETYQLPLEMKSLIYEKDISGIADALGKDHPLYQLMISPVSAQFQLMQQEFGDHPLMLAFEQLRARLEPFDVRFIFDLSFCSPQAYYDGFYFQLFLDENLPVLSGGQYSDNAFGIAVNLSNGGLL